MTTRSYDVIVIGGGISGTALFYQLARYTNVKSVALIEKYDRLAALNSNARCNSQTLHCGDIETNYTLDKARVVRDSAQMVVNYAESHPDKNRFIRKYPKMVLAVGEEECAKLRTRHESFSTLYPYLDLWERDKIAEVEPNVALVDGKFRKEEIVASGALNEYCAVDYGALSQSFANNAQTEKDKVTDLHLSTQVEDIQKVGDKFVLKTSQGVMEASSVVVCAGAHSLYLAHQMGYGMEYSTLPAAGSFYYVPQKLNGKVYTVQNDKLPFAAIHGDPDLAVPGMTRLGPTALLLPMLERYNWGSVPDFFKTLKFDKNVAKVFGDLFRDPVVRNYMFKNMLFEVPLVRTRLFLKDAQKIIPSLTLKELSFAKKIGGMRPQVIDRINQRLLMGEAKINPGTGILFNMTPSPGATSCLDNAYKDLQLVSQFIGIQIDEDRLNAELRKPAPDAAADTVALTA